MTDLQVGIFPHPSNKALMNVFTPHCPEPWLPEASPHSSSTLTAFLSTTAEGLRASPSESLDIPTDPGYFMD